MEHRIKEFEQIFLKEIPFFALDMMLKIWHKKFGTYVKILDERNNLIPMKRKLKIIESGILKNLSSDIDYLSRK